MSTKFSQCLLNLGLLIFLGGCQQDPTPTSPRSGSEQIFKALPVASTNISFANKIDEDEKHNFFTYQYVYNGGGVAVGDINNDGLEDVYFTGNLVPDKLYLNKGALKFEDISEKAITIGKEGWHSGVTMADVNADGLLDIYVCRARKKMGSANLLYINNGDLSFTEKASDFGLADTGNSVQSAFFDADRDGDLDLYVLNHPSIFDNKATIAEAKKRLENNQAESDQFYRNDNGKFTRITKEVGLYNHAFGLGVSISDIDNNGWLDIYVANDYDEPDFMYLNQGNGQFQDEIRRRTKHISNFGMGTDIADFNNDGFMDIVVLDMAFATHERSKRNMESMSTEKFWGLVGAGYHHQYMTNTLQLNAGNHTFSEIAQLAGIAKTDWSWAPLFADFNNDGFKDLIITNGYKRDIRDRDFKSKLNQLIQKKGKLTIEEVLPLIPTSKVSNYAFMNNGDLTFSNVSSSWGFKEAFNSNGLVYTDLDNDGDLDLIINNVDTEASVFENQVEATNFLQLKLIGPSLNKNAIGTRATIYYNDEQQTSELIPTRGYQSAVTNILHFGLGDLTSVDRIEIKWPNQKTTILGSTKVNQRLEIDYTKVSFTTPKEEKPVAIYKEIHKELGLDYRHQENPYDDFRTEILLPHKQSENGPLLGVGDANGDKLQDFFVGGAHGTSGVLYIQNGQGKFTRNASQLWAKDGTAEDLGSHFFDADGDGDQDLYIVSGGNEKTTSANQINDRLYLNDGKGNYKKAINALPKLPPHSGSRVASIDIDGDGDLDLFVPGRVVQGKYPSTPNSYFLTNDKGKFTESTKDIAPDLLQAGMITDFSFADIDGDKDQDLVVVGEWMPITVYKNKNGRFVKSSSLKDSEGFWFSIEDGDLDNDGDLDFVVGNIGKNHKFKGSKDAPFNLYANDFDKNGSLDIVLSSFQNGVNLPVRGKECTSEQMPFIDDKFPTYESFAKADMATLYSDESLKASQHLKAKTFYSGILINDGKGNLSWSKLPIEAQFSPVNGIVITDVNNDQHPDILLAGNHFGAEVETVRHDAGYGLCLVGNGKGEFKSLSVLESGFFAPANVKDLATIIIKGKTIILVSNNNYVVQAFSR